MDDRRRSRLGRLRPLGWLLTAAAFVFIGRWLWHLDRSTWATIGQLRWWALLLSLALFQLWFFLRFLAWERISDRHGYQDPRHRNIRMWATSELLRYIPGNIWSFAARFRGAVGGGTDKVSAAQALIVEAVGLVGGAAVVTFLFVWQRLWWLAPLLFLFLAVAGPKFMPTAWRRWHVPSVRPVTSWEFIGLLFLYTLTWLMYGLATVVLFSAFPHIPAVPLTVVLGTNVAAWLIGYLSLVTPMGLGVRELSFASLLAGRLPLGVASVVAIVTRLWSVVSELVFLGLVTLWSRNKA